METTMTMMLFMSLALLSPGSATYLFRLDDGGVQGDAIHPGFYGGYIDTETSPYTSNTTSDIAYTELLNTDIRFVYGEFNYATVTVDPISQQVFFHKGFDAYYDLTLIKGPLCKGKAPSEYNNDLDLICGNKSLSVVQNGIDNPKLLKDIGITSVTYYDSKIYFELVGTWGNSAEDYITRIQLRQFDGCDDVWKDNAVTLNILDCSRLIATISETQDNSNGDYEKFKYRSVGGPLKILDINNKRSFFTLILNKNYEDQEKKSVDLYLVTEGDTPVVLHQEVVTDEISSYTKREFYKMGIDYKDGRLCWSTSIRAYCAQMRGDQLENIEIMIDEEGIKTVCQYAFKPDKYVTGVAMINSSAIYFGCRQGYLGFVNKRNDDRDIHAVVQGGFGKLSGSSVYLLPDVTTCPGVTMATTSTTEAPTSGSVKRLQLYSSWMLFIMTYICIF